MAKNGRKYVYNWSAPVFRLTGEQISGCAYEPSASFTPSQDMSSIQFVGWYYHEKMGKKPFTQYMSHPQFKTLLIILQQAVNHKEETEFKRTLEIMRKDGFTYTKSGESVSVKRDVEGRIKFAFKKPNLPIVPFELKMPSMIITIPGGESVPIRERYDVYGSTCLGIYEMLLRDAITQSIENNEPKAASTKKVEETVDSDNMDDDDDPFS